MVISPVFGGCLDLGIATPDKYNMVAEKMSKQHIDFVVVMEDRQPDFFLTFSRFDPEAFLRLNRHGPNMYYPTQNDLVSIVKAFHEKGIRVMYGFWVHENRWVTMRHPELLLTDYTGTVWRTDDFVADFNPLLGVSQDPYHGIEDGDRFADYVCHQYSKMSEAFDFDGLFLGDGSMGFRRFGDDAVGVNYYDYGKQSVTRFLESSYYKHHVNCRITNMADSSILGHTETARDIWSNHWQEWIRWNCSEWAGFYKILADHVHSSGGKLGAYSCMNYGPAQAILHGVDYALIAKAGLDYLVFQTYDYAWHQHFGLVGKDVTTNTKELLSTCSYLAQSNTEVLFTAETSDAVEKWRCPIEHTVAQTACYSSGVISTRSQEGTCIQTGGEVETPLAGAFIVWLNNTPYEDITKIHETLVASRSGCNQHK